MRYLLLTGATGLVGRYVLRKLLVRQRPVAVLVRQGKLSSARDRMEAVLQHGEAVLGRSLPRPVVLESDLREPGLGLAPADERWITGHCDRVLHSAASMVFKAQGDGEPDRTNVEGTRALLELCRRTGLRDFHHVSTAYLCGLRTGRVLETELDLGQDLGNVYEASKMAAEKLVRQATWLTQQTFYRPGSIVGDSSTGYTTSYHGFYLPLQLAYTMCSRIPPEEMGDRFFSVLGLRGDEGKNFVPVDWVARALTELLLRPATHGQTYHLTAPRTVNVRQMQRVIQESIRRWSKRKTADTASPTDLATCEALFRRHMEVYRSHWRDDPQFDRTNLVRALPGLTCPEMTHERMMATARFAIEHNFATVQHQTVERPFDGDDWFAAHYARYAENGVAPVASGRDLTLEVSGSGGGVWHWSLYSGAARPAGLGRGNPADATCYLSTAVLQACAAGTLTAAEAARQGRLTLEAPAALQRQALAALDSILAAAPPASNAAESPPPSRPRPKSTAPTPA